MNVNVVRYILSLSLVKRQHLTLDSISVKNVQDGESMNMIDNVHRMGK